MEPIVIAVVVGLLAYVVVVALIPKRILADSTKYTRNMLKELERQTSSQDETLPPDNTNSILREHISQSNALVRVCLTLPGMQRLYPKLVRAGLSQSIDKFMLFCFMALIMAVYLLRGYGIWGILLGFLIVFLGARFFIGSRLRKRNETFLNGFPDALDMIVRSVRSGYPLNAAVRMVAENMQPPISDEFKIVADEASYGSSLVSSLQRLSYRIDEPDIKFFVVVLTVQQEVGGNLAEVLSNLAGIIRRRKHLRLKVKALTSEGRATAWVLGSLPVFVFFMIRWVSPTHLDPFFNTRLGNLMFLGAISLIVGGMLIVRKMSNIRV